MNPVVYDGVVYVIDDIGIIHAYDADDGSEQINDPLNDYSVTAETNRFIIKNFIIGNNGTIYISYEYLDTDISSTVYFLTALRADGTIQYIYEYNNDDYKDNNLTVDDKGYLYSVGPIGGLAGGAAIFVVDPYGEQVDRIAPYNSSTSAYFSLQVEGNLLTAARNQYGEFIVAQITHGDQTAEPVSIELADGQDQTVGENVNETVGVVVRDAEGNALSGYDIRWSSSDSDVIEVSEQNGQCYLVGKQLGGTANLTATVDGTSIEQAFVFTVVKKDPIISSIEIYDAQNNLISNGDTIDLEYKTEYSFTYRALDQYGNEMTGDALGVYVTYDGTEGGTFLWDGHFTLTAGINSSYGVISVYDDNVFCVFDINTVINESHFAAVYPKTAILNTGETLQLYAVDQYEERLTLDDVVWSSSDESIVEIDSNGVLTGISEGIATVTAVSGDYTFTRDVRVVGSMGYDWDTESGRVLGKIQSDPDGNLYYVSLSEDILYCVDSDKQTLWTHEISGSYFGINDGYVYLTVKDDNNDYYLTCVDSDGNDVWSAQIDYNAQMTFAEDGTIYSWIDNVVTAWISDGSKKWDLSLGSDVEWAALNADGKLIASTIVSHNGSYIYEIEDLGTEASATFDTYMDYYIGEAGKILVAENGTIYAYYKGKDGTDIVYGVCAVQNGTVLWEMPFGTSTSDINGADLILRNGVVYALSEELSMNGNATLHAYNADYGTELWSIDFEDLGDVEGKVTSENGEFVVDSEDNIYVTLQVKNGDGDWNETIVLTIDKDGNVLQKTSYDSSIYGMFDQIALSDDGVYVYTIHSGGYNLDVTEYYILNLTFEDNATDIPKTLLLTTPKNSVIVGNQIQLTANIYSQKGSLMSDEAVTWAGNNDNIGTVDENGVVTGVSAGTVYITATSVTDGSMSKTIGINVQESGAYFITMSEIDEAAQKTLTYYKGTGVNSDWVAFAVDAYGEDVNAAIYEAAGTTYAASLWDIVSSGESFGLMTDYERISLAIMACGYDPTDFGGMNVIEGIYNYPNFKQGNNAVMWGLIALNCADAEVPEEGKWDQEDFVNYLLDNKSGDGWGLATGSTPDTDLTAMAIYALAPYYNERSDVKAAVDEAVEWLKTVQNENGGFNYSGGTIIINTESTAQVIMALCSIGIDPQGDDWTQTGGNPVTAMFSMQHTDGQFEHDKYTGADSFATNQSLQAMAALKQFYSEGISTIFSDMDYETDHEVEAWMQLILDINEQLPEEISKVKKSDADMIRSLRSRYNALSDSERANVTNLDRLEAAEHQLKVLEDTSKPTIRTTLKSGTVTQKEISFTCDCRRRC